MFARSTRQHKFVPCATDELSRVEAAKKKYPQKFEEPRKSRTKQRKRQKTRAKGISSCRFHPNLTKRRGLTSVRCIKSSRLPNFYPETSNRRKKHLKNLPGKKESNFACCSYYVLAGLLATCSSSGLPAQLQPSFSPYCSCESNLIRGINAKSTQALRERPFRSLKFRNAHQLLCITSGLLNEDL